MSKKLGNFCGALLILAGILFSIAIGLIPLNHWLFALSTIILILGTGILIYIDILNKNPKKEESERKSRMKK